MAKENRTNRKKSTLLTALFGNRSHGLLEEEQVQSPGRLALRNFLQNPLGMTGLVVFLLIFSVVMVGPHFFPLDLSYRDNTQTNVPPTLNMMHPPRETIGHLVDISPGTTFGVGVTDEGKVHVWGYTRVTESIDLANIPEEVRQAKIVHIAAGYDHIAAIDENGKVYVWGNDRLGQAQFPSEIQTANSTNRNLNFVQLEAGYQYTAAVTADGQIYVWGNSNVCDIKVKQAIRGHVAEAALTTYHYTVLLDDGTVSYGGFQTNAFSQPPELRNIVDIASTSNTVAAVDADGNITVWGNVSRGEDQIPPMSSKAVELYGGLNHYTALLDNGEVVSWGDDTHGQATVPSEVNEEDIETVYAGFYQNYAVTKSGGLKTWGLKGYLCGTDQFGRDILTRIINGGRVTMTVGAVSVIISLIIGITLGGIAGYFGGWVDMLVMRVSEIVGGLPFLPFALILSAVIGTSISVEQRMYLIMVVLGVLSWPSICRLIRAQILSQREQEFVTAAKAMGVKEGTIVFRHILPNVLSLILVSATLDFATCMLTESTLSYLGFGISPPNPTWGNMLTGANDSIVIQQYWWRWVFPAAVFGICTICINLVGDALRDAFDPKSAER